MDVTPYADKVRVSWPEPENPEDVDNYTVTWYPKDDPSKKKTKTVPGGADAKPEAIIDDKLEPDTYYTVELTPNNKEGSGDPSVTEGVVVGQPDSKFYLIYFSFLVSFYGRPFLKEVCQRP